jgi:hypothetical protein
VRVSSPILTASIRVVVVGIENRAGNDANWSRTRSCPIRQPIAVSRKTRTVALAGWAPATKRENAKTFSRYVRNLFRKPTPFTVHRYMTRERAQLLQS